MLHIKVSIIIPIYNVAPYIIECMHSVYHQSYPHLEVILVDDCGTDNSMQIINSIDVGFIRFIIHLFFRKPFHVKRVILMVSVCGYSCSAGNIGSLCRYTSGQKCR